ncbi:MAG TPA: universal stress protein [Chloroflexi bacterium]|nr:universal stress protein [Chloroflexota bacterium]
MEAQSPFTHILVPTDGSETSVNAGRLAIQIAVTHHVPITFVYVVDDAIVDEIAGATSKTAETVHRELEAKGQRYLDYLSRMARDRGLQADQVVRHGIPHSEIADLARERGVDLIVIGRVGRRGPRRVLIGSVAERVIEYALCPVLVVRHTPTQR